MFRTELRPAELGDGPSSRAGLVGRFGLEARRSGSAHGPLTAGHLYQSGKTKLGLASAARLQPISARMSTILPRASRRIGLGAASGLLRVSTTPGDEKTRHGAAEGFPRAVSPEAFRRL
jgi:hypothetical protein